MSSSRVISTTISTFRPALRALAAVSVLLSSGCAYFHPAFVTNPSRLQAAQRENGVLVCERVSLTRSDCVVMSRHEVNRVLSEATTRY